MSLLLLESTSRPHLLCMFNAELSWQTSIDRCVGLIFAMSLWNVSLRLDGEQSMAECAGQVRLACEAVTKTMPFLTAHLTALKEGLPILKTMKVKDEEEGEDEATAAEVRGGRQSVLKAIKDAPAAKVLALQPAKGKDTIVSAASTRSSSSCDLEKAMELERAAQERATDRAKRTREEDVSTAVAAEASGKKAKNFKPPRKVPGKKSKKPVEKPDLSFLPGADDEEPE